MWSLRTVKFTVGHAAIRTLTACRKEEVYRLSYSFVREMLRAQSFLRRLHGKYQDHLAALSIGQWELFTKNRFLRSPNLKLQTLCERIITDIQMYSNFECLLQTSAEISLRLRSQMVKMQIARSSATRSASSKMVKTLKIVPRIYLKESI